jgi:c-di-GMP-binding flagellar brake protein YcgR
MVAFANENYAASKQFNRTSYNTGLKFKFIEERDRDAIVSYISNVQLKRIRQMRDSISSVAAPNISQTSILNNA